MPSEYGDLSRIALEADLDPDEPRARLARMTDRELLESGKAAAYMCTVYANFGEPPRDLFVLQVEAARAAIISRGVAFVEPETALSIQTEDRRD